jgi:SNF2 family DNA or RNA helicase
MSFRDLDLRGSYATADDRLAGFFVPVLSESVAYDRVTGYFRSSSLRSVARGLSRMLANDGRMRLIAGADLSDDDVRAIEEGEPLEDALIRVLLADPLEAITIIDEHRLEALAWLVREGRLEIKIGVPTDHLGRPLRRVLTTAYFHAKYAVFTDAEGNRIAIEGSNNESVSGHERNYENFSTAVSWMPEVWAWSGQPVVNRFEAHWLGHPDAGWKIVDLPEAVRERLVERVKDKVSPPPTIDPEEAHHVDAAGEAELIHYVAVAPRLRGGSGVGFATAGVDPLPHQISLARRLVATYPRSYLLADEVGLGKTIEAGLVIRELLVSGRAERILILVPASVIRQWQEELDEKFSLRVPRLDGGRFFFRRGGTDEALSPTLAGNVWAAFPVLLGSSHLARRRIQQRPLLDAGPWDVVFVDEAHHARRRGSKSTDTPNSLLTLLQTMKAARSWKALYLASATPMQMNAHEAWDLLELLGLTRLWGSSAENFTKYYEELREGPAERNWDFLRRMSADFFEDPSAMADEVLETKVKSDLGLAGSRPVRKFAQDGLSEAGADALSRDALVYLDEWLRRHTPTRDRIFRTTRKALRQYKVEGLLPPTTTIPQRNVIDRFIPMRSGDEQPLYDRIESYISRYYDAYLSGPGAQKPLGFIMTVYRRRLTSSFLAIERSLQRRREVLLGRVSADGLLDPDDVSAIEFSTLFEPDDLSVVGKEIAREVAEIDDFLRDLAKRPPDESKMQYLHDELNEAFHGTHDTAIVFTQYTDTMDYVREQLVPVYGDRVVTWSGRGGERWDPNRSAWTSIPKVDVKNLFREGRDVKILIGTDSMSEGLNLQTAGLLIDYDMPWNFMRVEQRIGRIDRIGGKPIVDIRNYFYSGTVEEQIYAGIKEDYDWFTDIVGPAQPVLGKVEGIIEQVAMQAPGTDRDKEIDRRVAEIRDSIEQAKARAVTLGDLGSPVALADGRDRPAIDLLGLERVLLGGKVTSQYFHPHPEIEGAYLLEMPLGKVPVTFRRVVLDRYAPEVRLITYQSEELDNLLATVGADTETTEGLPDTLVELEGRLASLEG